MKTAMSFRSCTAGELVSSNAGIDVAWTNTAVSSFKDKTFVFAMICNNSTIAFIVRQIVTNAFSRCVLYVELGASFFGCYPFRISSSSLNSNVDHDCAAPLGPAQNNGGLEMR